MQSAEQRRRPAHPNPELRFLLEETGWTQENLARAVGRLGTEAGVTLHYDRTSVAHWLRGSRPGPHVQHFVAEALSRRLGRPVTVGELGMGDGSSGGPGRRTTTYPAAPGTGTGTGTGSHGTASAGGSTAVTGTAAASGTAAGCEPVHERASAAGESGPEHPADRLTALTAPVVGPPRAAPPPPAPYRLALLPTDCGDRTAPSAPVPPDPRPPRAALPTPHARGGRPARRTSPGEVASVQEHTRFFALQADRHGGGHIRIPLAAYLSGLVRLLRSGGEGPHHPQLLAGASRLSYLLARVYVDEQRHGLAQRAFLTAAELAAEGSDPEGAALARRALSSQAHQLGHPRQSLALAESASSSDTGGGTSSARAFLHAGLAVALAADGQRSRALDALHRAECELARTPADLTTGPESPAGESVGAYQDAALLYQSSHVCSALGDRAGAIGELRSSLRARPPGERRSRALSHAELAELLLSCGRLEEACAAWQAFLEDCALVRSGCARRARSRIPALLRPYARERCVQALFTRMGSSTAGTGGSYDGSATHVR